jgi:hypothetical protein
MATNIKCSNCNFEFPLEAALNDELKEGIEKEKQALRQQMLEFKKTKEEEAEKVKQAHQKELQAKEKEVQQKLQEEKQLWQQQLEEQLRKNIIADFENQLTVLQQAHADNEEKLKLARQKELAFLQKEQALQHREAELEISVQKKLIEERTKLKEQLQKEEQDKNNLKDQEHQLQVRELLKQIEDQKKLTEEMMRKQEQGSMQLQGEVQELLLEEMLQNSFPFDLVAEVGKGVRGADCVQTVRTQFGQEAGKIIYESKRTKDFAADWIEKLKADMRSTGADVAVIVTQAFPKEMDRFGEKEGVYICNFSEVRSVALLLRNALLKIAEVRKSQENKGDKMIMLYDYLTGGEFSEQWKAIREGFMAMKLSIQKERDAMERLWKAREKQLEKVMLNATHVRASIEGIAGSDAVNLSLIDDMDTPLLD